jgi:hypothetical protein
MRLNSPLRRLRVALAAAAVGAACLAALAAFAQEEACAPPTVVDTAPPPLPDYDQPPVPGPGYMWSPGYWSWDTDESDYYWVPGTWALPPRPGLLWTPGYWAWTAGSFFFHPGYWGDHVGFYGGVPYGYGYTGDGYVGGRWDRGVFVYNRAVNNVAGVPARNLYEEKVTVNRTLNNISYNGGKGGIEARPTADDKGFAKERHFAPTTLQREHLQAASKDTSLFEKSNKGAPPIGATPRPKEFKGPGVAPARATTQAQPNAPATDGNKPAVEEKKLEEKKQPAESKPAIEEKKPVSGGSGQGVEKPAVEEKEKKTPPKATIEEKKPLTPQKTIEEKKPAIEERKPAIEEKKPAIEEKKPAIEEKKPAIEEKKPVTEEKRPEAPKPEPKAQVEKPAAQTPPPAPAAHAPPPAAAHPPSKPEEKKKPQP